MDDDLRQAVDAARQRAAKVGPMHALWDVIFDAEAWAEGKETLSKWGNGEAGKRKLVAALEPTLRQPAAPQSHNVPENGASKRGTGDR